ncbi:hypothetical protein JYT84_00450 [bacterium AH-315-M10]|nr:hypothetical protein [bacterium AH-315-M10]
MSHEGETKRGKSPPLGTLVAAFLIGGFLMVSPATGDTEGLILSLGEINNGARPADFVNRYAVKQLLLQALADPQFSTKAGRVLASGHLNAQAKIGLIYVLGVSRPSGTIDMLARLLKSSKLSIAAFSAMAVAEAGIAYENRPGGVTEKIFEFSKKAPKSYKEMSSLLKAFPRFSRSEIESMASHLIAHKSLEGLHDVEAARIQSEMGVRVDLASRYLGRVGRPAEDVLLNLLGVAITVDQKSSILSVLSDIGGTRTVEMARRALLDHSTRIQRYAIDILEKLGDESDIQRLLEFARLHNNEAAIAEAQEAARTIRARLNKNRGEANSSKAARSNNTKRIIRKRPSTPQNKIVDESTQPIHRRKLERKESGSSDGLPTEGQDVNSEGETAWIVALLALLGLGAIIAWLKTRS